MATHGPTQPDPDAQQAAGPPDSAAIGDWAETLDEWLNFSSLDQLLGEEQLDGDLRRVAR